MIKTVARLNGRSILTLSLVTPLAAELAGMAALSLVTPPPEMALPPPLETPETPETPETNLTY